MLQTLALAEDGELHLVAELDSLFHALAVIHVRKKLITRIIAASVFARPFTLGQ